MAPDDSTRCLRCRCHTNDVVDDGSNAQYHLCVYCQKALAGLVAIIEHPVKSGTPAKPKRRGNPKTVRTFWRKRKEAKMR